MSFDIRDVVMERADWLDTLVEKRHIMIPLLRLHFSSSSIGSLGESTPGSEAVSEEHCFRQR